MFTWSAIVFTGQTETCVCIGSSEPTGQMILFSSLSPHCIVSFLFRNLFPITLASDGKLNIKILYWPQYSTFSCAANTSDGVCLNFLQPAVQILAEHFSITSNCHHSHQYCIKSSLLCLQLDVRAVLLLYIHFIWATYPEMKKQRHESAT